METIPWHIRREMSLSHLLDPQALWGLWKHGEIQGPPEISQEGTLHRVSSLPSTQDQGSRSFWDSTNRQPGLGLLRKVGKWAGLSHRSLLLVICPVTPSPSPPTGSTRPPRPSRADPSLLWEGRFSCLDALRTLVRPGWGWWWWSRVELGVPPGRRETRGFAGRIRGPQISAC